jgi:hypothetical protein
MQCKHTEELVCFVWRFLLLSALLLSISEETPFQFRRLNSVELAKSCE